MARIRLKHVNAFRDRHGKARYYFRRGGGKAIPLPGLPGSAEFMAAYAEALEGTAKLKGIAHAAGTVAAIVSFYVGSGAFNALAEDTKRKRRRVLERFAAEHGAKRITQLERRHVQDMVDAKRATPGGARIFLSSISVLLAHAVAAGVRDDNPALGIKRPKLSKDGWRTWSEADVARFEDKHPVGSKARLALALLLYTGQRVSDVIRMGRQHVHDGVIDVRQQKTGAPLSIPIHPELGAIIDSMPVDNLNFLMTSTGKPFTANGFCHWFSDRCRETGLPAGLSAHGLRKAMCRRLAEAGCTVHQIMAISGHQTLSEVQRYTKAAEQSRMARQACRPYQEPKLTNLVTGL